MITKVIKKEKIMENTRLEKKIFKYQFMCLVVAGFILGFAVFSMLLKKEFDIYLLYISIFGFSSWSLIAFYLKVASQSKLFQSLFAKTTEK